MTLALMSALFTACSPRSDRSANERLVQELTDTLTLLSKEVDLNGFGVAIVSEKGVLYQNGFGFADVAAQKKYTDSTLQALASISKTFIGLAVLKAQDLGKIKLDDPVNRYLPFKVVNPFHPELPITIRHLVTHTSSILDAEPYLHHGLTLRDTNALKTNLGLDIAPCRFNPPGDRMPMDVFIREVLDTEGRLYTKASFAERKPGALFEYSNVGATLAALVVQYATGEAFDAFTGKHILQPLGMSSSGWGLDAITLADHSRLYRTRTDPFPWYQWNTYPDGAMITSSRDMAKYMVELVRGFKGHGTLLTKQSYAEYFTPQLKAENFTERNEGPYNNEYNMGITMGFSAQGYFGHTGGDPGMFSMMFFNEATGIGRFMIVNTDLNNWDHHKHVWDLLDRYAVKLDKGRE